ncbi:MAG: hypothetical protein QXD15_06115, partial [Thermoplasmata archaeon]
EEREVMAEDETICPVCHGKKEPEEIVCERCARASEIIAEEKSEEIALIAAEIFAGKEEKPSDQQPVATEERKEELAVGVQAESEGKVGGGEEEKPTQGIVGGMSESTGARREHKICPSCGFEVTSLICSSCGYRLGDEQL